MKNFIKKLILFLSIFIFLISFKSILALDTDLLDSSTNSGVSVSTVKDVAGYSSTSAQDMFSKVVQIILGLSGTASLVLVIISGVYYLMSKGDPTKMKKALKIMSSGFIGLVLMVSAYTISRYIIQQAQRTVGVPVTQNSNSFTNNDGTTDSGSNTTGGGNTGGSGTATTLTPPSVAQIASCRQVDVSSGPDLQSKISICENSNGGNQCIYNSLVGECTAMGSVANNQQCLEDSWCSSRFCSDSFTVGVKICFQKNSLPDKQQCLEDEWCQSNYCVSLSPGSTTKICIKKNSVDNGGSCGADDWCQSGVCSNGFCIAPRSLANYATCSKSGDCISGNCAAYNDGYVCLPISGVNAAPTNSGCNYSDYYSTPGYKKTDLENSCTGTPYTDSVSGRKTCNSWFAFCKSGYVFEVNGINKVSLGSGSSINGNCTNASAMQALTFSCYNATEAYSCYICVSK